MQSLMELTRGKKDDFCSEQESLWAFDSTRGGVPELSSFRSRAFFPARAFTGHPSRGPASRIGTFTKPGKAFPFRS